MTREEMWKEFENQLIRETRTPLTMSFDNAEKLTKLGIEETVAKWKKRLEQTRWIPVSERLPEAGELILFSTKTDRVFEGRYFDDNTDRQWYSFRDDTFAWNNVVTAWMPLPQPYKAESEDQE